MHSRFGEAWRIRFDYLTADMKLKEVGRVSFDPCKTCIKSGRGSKSPFSLQQSVHETGRGWENLY